MALILVVDDEPDLLALLKAQLSHLGHEVLLASDGAEGLLQASTRRPDILLTDVVMPSMDGVEMIERLQARPETRTIPMIVLSARSDAPTKARLSALGARVFLEKPYSLAALADHIRDLTARTHPRVGSA